MGYLNRRPYLWLVDLATQSIESEAELRDVPQGIDEVIPLDAAVAVRCGPTWFALEPDLSGEGRRSRMPSCPWQLGGASQWTGRRSRRCTREGWLFPTEVAEQGR